MTTKYIRGSAEIGENYASLGFYTIIGIVITLLLVLGGWYGYYWYPNSQLAAGEPLVEQIPLEAMPSLPDSLAETYDTLNDNQRVLISTYGYIDEEAGIVHIPVETAAEIMLENNGFPVREGTND